MKVALFFDGKNFYMALRRYAPALELDYNKLARWLADRVSGGNGDFVGAHYYTGFTPPNESGSEEFSDFLNGLEIQLGYFVKREPRVRRTSKCKECGFAYAYRTEKRVDTRLVADMIHFAAVNAYDVAVLLSGDQDFAPAVDAVNALGKRVYLATWPGHGVSKELRIRCYGQIRLEEGESEFSTDRLRSGGGARAFSQSDDPEENMIAEIARAMEYHQAYVSRGHFLNRWRPQFALPATGRDREVMLDKLIAEGRVLEYDAESKGNSFKAIKLPCA